MDTSALPPRWFHGKIRLLFILIAVLVVSQCLAFPLWTTFSLFHSHRPSPAPPVEFAFPAIRKGDMSGPTIISPLPKVIYASSSNAFGKEAAISYELVSDGDRDSRKGFIFEKREVLDKSFKVEDVEYVNSNFTQKGPKHAQGLIGQTGPVDDNISYVFYAPEAHSKIVFGNIQGKVDSKQVISKGTPSEVIKYMKAGLSSSDMLLTVSSNRSGMQSVVEMEHENEKTELLESTLPVLRNKSMMGILSTRNKLIQPASITQMNSLLLQTYNSSSYMRPRWSSQRDRELLSAKVDIANAPVIANPSGLYAPVFRNVSEFIRSYELMERKLKVYIYKEGEKPIFHQPKMRGLYASEGWFMKLMEANKNFIVRDPRKAHLFYLPFSTQMLRINLSGQNFQIKKMEQYVERYLELIAKKYRFWNRTEGADHFFVACHDWASRITRRPMQNCIRSLCNANIVQGFKIGKDTSLPVTYIHSTMDPIRGIGEKPPLERPILAFFAGGLHGYLREILLKHWQNKVTDMKIFGPMPRDLEVTEEKYQALQLGVKKVQRHFQWHRSPAKYDLFHMILHSVWFNRVSQIRPR
ncbi:probable glycosyltransferase At5g25310 isoform X2 [Neltuma alba]|uniref:probable glycosyltransferase At5g25310 isoform X2 n=1 Tax=Neltuma alba TaxID=207710 RepID=UPI0010A31D45|nr:probable glycosyltransferase At5g25310 isoform X2 [Prosopis alba]